MMPASLLLSCTILLIGQVESVPQGQSCLDWDEAIRFYESWEASTNIASAVNANGCRQDPNIPDTARNVTQIIESRGFQWENHDVVTDDGYILTIQRVINPLVDTNFKEDGLMRPVILQHGLLASATDWVINSAQDVHPEPYPQPNTTDCDHELSESQAHSNSLAFYLANRGFDVWLANSRGNHYAQRHINWTSEDSRFWSFSFDEQISYDLPATIELVQRITNRSKLAYVGHSQGTVMMFGLMADRPEYSDIIEPFVALAPVAFVDNVLTPARHFQFITPIAQHINAPLGANRMIINYLADQTCSRSLIARREICANFLFLLTGFNMEEMDLNRLEAYLCHLPSGTSVKNLAHYGQEIRSRRFAHFDHGVVGNQMRYGQTTPPDFDLSKIRSNSIAMFTAENDWLASPKDVARLLKSLQVPVYQLVNMTLIKPKWNHIDFLYGKSTGDTVNPKIYKILYDISTAKCL